MTEEGLLVGSSSQIPEQSKVSWNQLFKSSIVVSRFVFTEPAGQMQVFMQEDKWRILPWNYSGM
jgi:hypothetical protein